MDPANQGDSSLGLEARLRFQTRVTFALTRLADQSSLPSSACVHFAVPNIQRIVVVHNDFFACKLLGFKRLFVTYVANL